MNLRNFSIQSLQNSLPKLHGIFILGAYIYFHSQGPYIAYADQFWDIGGNHSGISFYLRVSHFNPFKPYELQRLTGNVTLRQTITDDNLWGRDLLHCKQFYVDGKSKNIYKCGVESMTLTSVIHSTLYVKGIQRVFSDFTKRT